MRYYAAMPEAGAAQREPSARAAVAARQRGSACENGV